ncbi:hypothetical protein KY339_01255 [Candidatus Woesearchaeota archaeon]|nr:hypothetical protein [Candidatus Woesearchaeota archaeon]
MDKIKVTYPPMGVYNEAFEGMLKSLDVDIIKGDITERTINLGVKNSPVMMCYPYKVILGGLMDALDKGAEKIVHFSSCGQCRQRHYWKVQEHTLRDLGYDFEIVALKAKSVIKNIKQVNPKINRIKIAKETLNLWRNIKETEKSREEFKPDIIDKKDINILISGEIYTVFESSVNLNIIEKLKKLGAKPKYALSLVRFIKELMWELIPFVEMKDKYMQEAKTYVDGPTGGHGLHSISNALFACDKGYDGFIHLLPMSCAPEILVEPAVTSICQKNGMPLLMVESDENNSEVNMDTRLETFIELIKRKKLRKNGK